MPTPLRALVSGLVMAFAACLAAGCGQEPPPGGSGTLEHAADGRPDVLVLAGSPYEMGWWQGHLLRERIRSLHGAWRAALLASIVPPVDGGQGGKALRRGLDAFCDLCVDQTEHRLGEAMLQELEGIAAGAGMTPRGVLRLEVMRDALRMKGMEPRMLGALGVAREPGGYEARAWWSGPDAKARGGDLLLVHRKPVDGVETLVVGFPGSVGGLAGVAVSGLGYLSAEGEVKHPQRMGFGGGRPLAVAAREALEENTTAYDLAGQVTGTMGHPLLAFSLETEDRDGEHVTRLEAMGGFHVYTAPDPPVVMGRSRFLGIGPYEVLNGPGATAVRELSRKEDLDLAEAWLQLRGHAVPDMEAAPTGPWVRVRWQGTAGTVTLHATADGPGREASIGGDT